MRAAVSKDGHTLRTRRHPSRRSAVAKGDRGAWVMISILLDAPVKADDPALAELYDEFRRGVRT